MASSDPLGDMLTAIRNANLRRKEKLEIGHSNLKEGVLRVLREEGFIKEYKMTDHPKHGSKIREIHVYLKYGLDKERVIRGLVRTSKPGRREFVAVDGIPKVQDGFGIAILSTSQGVLSSRAAKVKRAGGEVLCTVW